MIYLVKYTDSYDFGNRIFHYFDNEKEFDKYRKIIDDQISEEMKLGKQFTHYKIYRFSTKDSLIDTLLNSINHSGLNIEADIVADLMKD